MPDQTADLERPADLAGFAAEEWDRLTAAHQFRPAQRGILLARCTVFARWQEAESQVKALGAVVRAPTGAAIQSPWLSIADRCIRQLAALDKQLGISGPTKRSTSAATTTRPRLAQQHDGDPQIEKMLNQYERRA